MRRTRGFTLMEILVVMSIIIMAAGIMVPSVAEFMRNQKLKSLGGKVANTLVWARNEAVSRREQVQAVFLRYGVWMHSERFGFLESNYRRLIPPGGEERFTLELRFAGITSRQDLDKLPRRRGEMPGGDENIFEPTGPGIPRGAVTLVFHRDGTIDFRGTSPGDRPTSLFLKDPPADADIIVREKGNRTMGLVDLRPSGGIRSRVTVPDVNLTGESP
ncbi:MAG: prepilin-type N-terminal cleavage/methylation domain-containing protein [Planctomycetes bacterium]|nr:prepilin-type N-terminal cleavage/methylation domain-containing protein [Planctomycetota bacterium]